MTTLLLIFAADPADKVPIIDRKEGRDDDEGNPKIDESSVNGKSASTS